MIRNQSVLQRRLVLSRFLLVTHKFTPPIRSFSTPPSSNFDHQFLKQTELLKPEIQHYLQLHPFHASDKNVNSVLVNMLLETYTLGEAILKNSNFDVILHYFHNWTQRMFHHSMPWFGTEDEHYFSMLLNTMETFQSKTHPSYQLLLLFWQVMYPPTISTEILAQNYFSTNSIESYKQSNQLCFYYLLQYIQLWYYMKQILWNSVSELYLKKCLEIIATCASQCTTSILPFATQFISFFNHPTTHTMEEYQTVLQEISNYLQLVSNVDPFIYYFWIVVLATCETEHPNEIEKLKMWKQDLLQQMEQSKIVTKHMLEWNVLALQQDFSKMTSLINKETIPNWNYILPMFHKSIWRHFFSNTLDSTHSATTTANHEDQLLYTTRTVCKYLFDSSTSFEHWKQDYYQFLNCIFAYTEDTSFDSLLSVLKENEKQFLTTHFDILIWQNQTSLLWLQEQKLIHPLQFDSFLCIITPLELFLQINQPVLPSKTEFIDKVQVVLERDPSHPLAIFCKLFILDQEFVLKDPSLAMNLLQEIKSLKICFETIPNFTNAAGLLLSILKHVSTLQGEEIIATNTELKTLVQKASQMIDNTSFSSIPFEWKRNQIEMLVWMQQVEVATAKFYILLLDLVETNTLQLNLSFIYELIKNQPEWIHRLWNGILYSLFAFHEPKCKQLALQSFELSMETNPNALNYAQRGCFYMEMGELELAELDLKEALQLDKNSLQTQYYLALLGIEKLKKLNPEVLELKIDETMLHLTTEQEKQKENLVQQSLQYLYQVYKQIASQQLEKEYISIHKTLALLFYLKGMFEESMIMFTKHLQVMKHMNWQGKIAEAYHLRAQVFIVLKKYFEALDDLDSITKEFPEYPHKVDISYLKEWIKELQLNQLIHTS